MDVVSVSKKTSKKRIESLASSSALRISIAVSKKTSKKRIERYNLPHYRRIGEEVSKKTSKKRIERYRDVLPIFSLLAMFQRKPQKRGLKDYICNSFANSIASSFKENLKKED